MSNYSIYKSFIIKYCLRLYIIIFFIFPLNITAQNQGLRFNHFSIEQGLSQVEILCIIQDHQGFMWFGTQDGLNKFDGYNFTVYSYDIDDNTSLSHNFILSIIEDSRGNLWIGTRGGGLNKFDQKSETFTRYQNQIDNPHSLNNNIVRSILEDSDGNIWVGTDGGGINKLDTTSGIFIHYTYSVDNLNSLSSNNILTIFEDSHNILWIGTDGGGLNKLNRSNNNFTHYIHKENNIKSISHNSVTSIFEDTEGILWIGTNGGGINKFNPSTETFTPYLNQSDNPQSLSDNNIRTILEDTNGTLWIGTYGSGLKKFDKYLETFTTYKHFANNPQSLSNDRVLSIFEDISNNLWIGTQYRLNMYDPMQEVFTLYQHHENISTSLSKNDIFSITEDTEGYLWIGTYGGGINKFDRSTNTFIHYQHQDENPQSLNLNYVRSIFEDSKGNLWIGTDGGGLNKFDRKSGIFTHYLHQSDNPQSISHNNVRAIFEDSMGDLWITTFGGGLNKFNPNSNTFTHYKHQVGNPQSLSHNNAYSINEDSKGTLWIGTDGGGLNKFNRQEKTFSSYTNQENNPQSTSSNFISCIYEDTEGTLWLGTDVGFNKFNQETETFIRYSTKDGLPNNVVYGILEDNKGYLWLSTNKGLSRFNPKTNKFKNFDKLNGLQSNEFNGGAYFKDRRGRMYFGGTNGLNEFYPDSIQDDSFIPQVVITDFLLFNKSVSITKKGIKKNKFELPQHIGFTKEITLNYTDYIFGFEFSALNYRQAEKNQFKYKLEGFDEDWIETEYLHRRVTYTNIPHGNYTFRVIASNADNYWNEKGANIKLAILPPFWKTWWFRISSIIFLILSIYIWINSRIRNIKIQKKTLEKKVKIRTEELYEANTRLKENQTDLEIKQEEILAQRDAIESQNKELEKLSIIASETDNAITIMDAQGNFEWFNNAYIKMSGYSLDEFKKIKGKNIINVSTNKNIKNIVSSCINNKKSVSYESEITAKSGEKIWTQVTVTPILGKDDNVIKLISIESDIRKLKEYEKKILNKNDELAAQQDSIKQQNKDIAAHRDSIKKQNKELEKHRNHLDQLVKARTAELEKAKEKAEESDRLKSAFLANMSHEIRTPMNAIVGFSSLLNDPDITDSDREDLIFRIEHSGNTLMHLINDIIDIAKIEAGQLDINKKECPVNNILTELYNTYLQKDELINNKNLELKFKLEIEKEDFLILTDTIRIQQVLINLLDNAFKFTDKGSIEFGYTTEKKNNEPYLTFYVKDTGAGLTKEQQKTVFTRFTKFENDRKKFYSGAGLGLAISKNIIELLDGEIWVESEPNKGATFYFTIPLTELVTDGIILSTPKPESSYNWKNKKILIAEDENSNYELLEVILKKAKAKIIRAINGTEVLSIFHEEKNLDLILMDIKMPEIDGLEVTKQIRNKNADIPIIAITAFAMVDDEKISLKSGCNDYISKPIDRSKLLEMLNKFLG